MLADNITCPPGHITSCPRCYCRHQRLLLLMLAAAHHPAPASSSYHAASVGQTGKGSHTAGSQDVPHTMQSNTHCGGREIARQGTARKWPGHASSFVGKPNERCKGLKRHLLLPQSLLPPLLRVAIPHAVHPGASYAEPAGPHPHALTKHSIAVAARYVSRFSPVSARRLGVTPARPGSGAEQRAA